MARRISFELFPVVDSLNIDSFAGKGSKSPTRKRLEKLSAILGDNFRAHSTKGNYIIRGDLDDFYYGPKTSKLRFVGTRTQGINHNSRSVFVTGNPENVITYFANAQEYLEWSDELMSPYGYGVGEIALIQDFFIKAETEKAILLGQGEREGWFPHSKIDFCSDKDGFLIPAWLAMEKDFKGKPHETTP